MEHAIALADEVSRFGRHVVLDGPAELEPFVTKVTESSSGLVAPFRILQSFARISGPWGRQATRCSARCVGTVCGRITRMTLTLLRSHVTALITRTLEVFGFALEAAMESAAAAEPAIVRRSQQTGNRPRTRTS